MELRHLIYFSKAAEIGSFTKAAEALNISQPPLSRQIKDLEDELGAKLLLRKRHALELTPEGTTFLKYTKKILELSEDAKDAVASLASNTATATQKTKASVSKTTKAKEAYHAEK